MARFTKEQELTVRAKMWNKVLPVEIAQAFRNYGDTIDAIEAELDREIKEAANQETETIWRKWLEYIDRPTLFYDWLRDRFEAAHHAKAKGDS